MNLFTFNEFNRPLWIFGVYWMVYAVVFLIAINYFNKSKYVRHNIIVVPLFVLFLITFSLFYCINTDYFTYRDYIQNRDLSYLNKEKVYTFFILFLQSKDFQYPYELFRLVVWGGAYVLVWFQLRLLKSVPTLDVMLVLFVLFVGVFSYSRASLAMAIFFFGLILWIRENAMIFRSIALILMLCSIFFHKEMIIAVALFPLLYYPFEKKNYLLFSVIILVFAVVLVLYFMDNIHLLDVFSDDTATYSRKIEVYNNRIDDGKFQTGIGGWIHYIVFYFSFVIISFNMMTKGILAKTIVYLYRYQFGIIITTIAFSIVFGFGQVYVYRVLYFSIIPLSILLAYQYRKGYINKSYFFFILLLSLIIASRPFFTRL